MNMADLSAGLEPSAELRDYCAIVGTATSRLGKVPGVSSLDLLVEAIRNAIDDAGLKASDIDGVDLPRPGRILFASSARRRTARHQRAILDDAHQRRREPDPVHRHRGDGDPLRPRAVRSFAASAATRGRGRTRRKKRACATRRDPPSQRPREFGPEYGYFGATAAHAFGATRHMHLYGTTRDDFGAIAHGFPRARAAQSRRADEEAADDGGLSRRPDDRRAVRHV